MDLGENTVGHRVRTHVVFDDEYVANLSVGQHGEVDRQRSRGRRQIYQDACR